MFICLCSVDAHLLHFNKPVIRSFIKRYIAGGLGIANHLLNIAVPIYNIAIANTTVSSIIAVITMVVCWQGRYKEVRGRRTGSN